MLRPVLLGRSIFRSAHISPLCISQARTFQAKTRLLCDDSAATHSLYESLEKKVNTIQADMMTTKSEVKSEIAVLTGKINSLDTSITAQMKSLSETVSAQISVLNANMESRLDKFENRFLFRMLFATSTIKPPTDETPAIPAARQK